MKIVFLDIDGVMNKPDSWHKSEEEQIVDEKCELLKQLVENTGCKIVLSSSWRNVPRLRHIVGRKFAQYNIEIYDCTPTLNNAQRGDEIREWLNHHPNVTSFVIFDDEDHMCEFTETNLVKTDFMEGLKQKHINIALSILMG